MLFCSDTCSVEQTLLYKTHYVTSLQNVAMFGYVNKKFIVIGYYIVKKFNDKSTSNSLFHALWHQGYHNIYHQYKCKKYSLIKPQKTKDFS